MDLSKIEIGEFVKLRQDYDVNTKCGLVLERVKHGWLVIINDHPLRVSGWLVGATYPLGTPNDSAFERHDYKPRKFKKLYEKLQSV